MHLKKKKYKIQSGNTLFTRTPTKKRFTCWSICLWQERGYRMAKGTVDKRESQTKEGPCMD